MEDLKSSFSGFPILLIIFGGLNDGLNNGVCSVLCEGEVTSSCQPDAAGRQVNDKILYYFGLYRISCLF